ncbi:OmpA/MotB domain protein [Pseudopedobacter saltans DSM 12145]|uniref:OmpA/MotB domain protein n=1 Tax=Pseudopedobacter saltans (strain ATCC 51119 / DSM 12145 / JCM 21818 / CCUG 39354 / LMG 10337 / NBRC 100064 / NCIMB 13643) TaxID=762903 RepID=F0SBG4_PSESL|nr:OmpA family protein [Pseudopedobacter saltans]ADY51610.1 OmpA/MotB domain protein [Pseudopedobacter saltans DSM 12145]
MKYKILSIIVFTLTMNVLSAAEKPKERDIKRAKEAYQSLSYIQAIKLLKPLVENDTSNNELLEMLAYSYKMVKNYDETLEAYTKLSKRSNVKPEWKLYYAEALANKQQYEKSVSVYRDYLKSVPNEKRASSFVNANLKAFEENRGAWNIAFTNINTLSADYAPMYYKEGLLFSSNRMTSSTTKRVFAWDNTPFSDLYRVEKLKDIKHLNADSVLSNLTAKGNKPYKFNDDDTEQTSNDSKVLGVYQSSLERDSLLLGSANSLKVQRVKGKVNSKYHEGSVAVFPDGSIIFTRNNFYKGSKNQSKEGLNKLKMYTANADFSSVKEFPYNDNEYSVGHPALSKDGNILIFASDMPGGYGGTDLYYSVKSGNGQWIRPINMGKGINTEGDEMFPFLDSENTLYFSSTGFAGLGGLDVFEVKLKDMKPLGQPKNMGMPINSPEDDFALIKDSEGKQGFFSSNRSGNDDIYSFKRSTHRIILKGVVKDGRLGIALPGSRILLRTLDGVDTLRVGPKGVFEKELAKETDYELTAQKLGYVSQQAFTTSVGINKDSTILLNINLFKTESNQQWVINNCDSLKRVFNFDNIYYDLDRAEIRPDARPALDKIALIMLTHPEVSIITSSHCDSRASNDYNKLLSIRRGNSAKAYLVAKGVAANRIKVEYYGKTRLTNRCYDGVPCSEEEQQMNRRTEFEAIVNGVNLSQLDCNEGF